MKPVVHLREGRLWIGVPTIWLWAAVMLIGLGLVGLFVVRAPTPLPPDAIAVVDGRPISARPLSAAERTLAAELGTPVTAGRELLVEALIENELLYRYGRRLGLDERDPVVRGRVIQQVLRLERARIPDPDTATLRAYWRRRRDRWRRPPRWRLEVLEPARLAEQLAPARWIDAEELRRLLGRAFVAALARVTDTTTEPLRLPSNLGTVRVRVVAAAPATTPSFAQVVTEVARAWRAEAERRQLRRLLARLRAAAEIRRR